jgi:hypothetical protein
MKRATYTIGWGWFAPTIVYVVQDKVPCPCTAPHENHSAFLNDRGDGTIHFPQRIVRIATLDRT